MSVLAIVAPGGSLPLDVLGIWIGSPSRLPSLRREGIFRFVFNLVKNLMISHPLRVEVWCQEHNLPRVRELFSELNDLPGFRERIAFCTEKNAGGRLPGKSAPGGGFFLQLGAVIAHDLKTGIYFLKDTGNKFKRLLLPASAVAAAGGIYLAFRSLAAGRLSFGGFFFLLPALLLVLILFFRDRLEWVAIWAWDLFKQALNLLPRAANRFSAADCFLVQNFDMANAWKIDRLKVINLHDLYTTEFASLFQKSGRSRRLLFQGRQAVRYAERLAADGSFFVSNSDHIRRAHALKLIPGLREENTGVIFLPAIIPDGIRHRLATREAILAAFRIRGEYVFYPTHIRPYKNILTLLKAFRIVLDRGHGLTLVLTGNLADDAECQAFARGSGLEKKIIMTGEISEVEMYGLYRYAALTAVPTLSEGGFPWQALEAMAMETPVTVSRIPVVEERLRDQGLVPEACGLPMFEPHDEDALAQTIIRVLGHRAQAVSGQKTVRETLLAYDWQQLSERYFRLFTRLLEREC